MKNIFKEMIIHNKMECESCKKVFSTKGNLYTHQKTAKFCLKIQKKDPEISHKCSYCSKIFTRKDVYDKHINSHLTDPVTIKITEENTKMEEELKQLKIKLDFTDEIKVLKSSLEQKEDGLKNALEQIVVLKETLKITQDQLKMLQDANIKKMEEENKTNKKKIESMTKKYVKKQERVQFEVPNVIYVVTTACLKKERRYILGKAGNLTDRLSTYNKTDEHEVVYYQGCGNADNMPLVESLVFHKLKEYREQANRERFVLPEEGSVDMFIEAIKSSVEACK